MNTEVNIDKKKRIKCDVNFPNNTYSHYVV